MRSVYDYYCRLSWFITKITFVDGTVNSGVAVVRPRLAKIVVSVARSPRLIVINILIRYKRKRRYRHSDTYFSDDFWAKHIDANCRRTSNVRILLFSSFSRFYYYSPRVFVTKSFHLSIALSRHFQGQSS